MDRRLIEDVADLKSRMTTAEGEIEELKESKKEWLNFCVRVVLKTGLFLMSIITLGTFWGYLSPGARELIERLIK